MELVYTLINFLLLAVIVFIALRKTIKKIFTSRRERIDTELDEAEALERASKELEEARRRACRASRRSGALPAG